LFLVVLSSSILLPRVLCSSRSLRASHVRYDVAPDVPTKADSYQRTPRKFSQVSECTTDAKDMGADAKGIQTRRLPTMFSAVILYVLILALPVAFLFRRRIWPTSIATTTSANDSVPAHVDPKPVKNIMQPPRQDLQPPKDDPFTLEQLKEYDGSDPEKPIYVSIKGASQELTPPFDIA
jgi:hypothetical protein